MEKEVEPLAWMVHTCHFMGNCGVNMFAGVGHMRVLNSSDTVVSLRKPKSWESQTCAREITGSTF